MNPETPLAPVGAPGRRVPLRLKSLIVYGALILATAGVSVFVLQQRVYLLGQFDALQAAYDAETQIREVDLTILHTVQAQVLGMETLGIDQDSPQLRDHLWLLLDFYDNVIARHVEQGSEAVALHVALEAAYDEATGENMAALGDAVRNLRRRIEGRLEESRAHRETLASHFRGRADLVAVVALVLLLMVFSMLGIINALFFTRLTKDLRTLMQRAQGIAGGQREDRIPLTRNDEVGDLVESINRMAEDLEAHDRALEIERRKSFHQEKMAAIGVLAAGIAHEVGNPIAAITGLVEELKDACIDRPCGESEAVVRRLQMILEQADRLKKITREVSAFARPQPNRCELLDLNALIRGACSLMRYDRRWQGIDVQLDLDVNLPAIQGVPDQLMQVVMNLLVNAADALEDVHDRVREIRITTGVDAERGGVLLVVQDDGQGMDDETLRHALEAFYTTKEVGRGTGLGLSLCHSIVTGHEGGEILLESTPGVGTAVRIFLPLGGCPIQVDENMGRHDA